MTLVELKRLLDATGYPVAYSHFNEPKATPFITYLVTYSSNFHADNKVHKKINNVDIELYTDKKDLQAEGTLELILDEQELPYDKVETFISEEKLYQIIYEVQVILMSNKVEFGLKNVHYAPLEVVDGEVTYDTPIAIPGAVTLTLTPRGELTEFYADNMLYYSAAANDGYDGSLSIATIPEQFAIDALGEEKDEQDGVLTEKADAKQKQFALLFEFDGDKKATRHVLYSCSANRPTVTSGTTTSTKEPQPNELTFISSAREGDLKVKTKTTADTKEEVYNNWYQAVYEKTTLPEG